MPKLEAYVKGVVGAFAKDDRVLGWDLWNEPDNGADQYSGQQGKEDLVLEMLTHAFAWARAAEPSQPLTSGVWVQTDWSRGSSKQNSMQRLQLGQSDVISFHDYGWHESFESKVKQLQSHGGAERVVPRGVSRRRHAVSRRRSRAHAPPDRSLTRDFTGTSKRIARQPRRRPCHRPLRAGRHSRPRPRRAHARRRSTRYG